MPELPEVECIVRGLNYLVTGKKIVGLEFFFERMLAGVAVSEFTGQICGLIIKQVKRRGKYILFYLSGGKVLEVHLRMTGRFSFYPGPTRPEKHIGVVFYFDGGSQLHFLDIRKFATFKLWDEKELYKAAPFCLGPDPLQDDFTLDLFLQMLEKKPRSKIKTFFLDQKNIMGMGNIYTDETLFRAGIHPEKRTGSLGAEEKKYLFETINDILREAVALGGTSISDYRNLEGVAGNFQNKLQVYRKKGAACPKCSNNIERIVVSGRGTYFCPYCQK